MISFRKLDISQDQLDVKTGLLIRKIALLHNETPRQWNREHGFSDEDIEKTMEWIINTEREDLYLQLAEDEDKNLSGFIWAARMPGYENLAIIISLYVAESYRRQGLARRLKEDLEAWCREKKIKSILASVHYSNQAMLELNKKLGYKAGMVSMRKDLI